MTRVKGAFTAMDTFRGNFGSDDIDQAKFDSALDGVFEDALDDGQRDWDVTEDESVNEPPPVAIGTDERRMQVRAYNHWASLLGDSNFPSIEDLDPANLTDFGPYSVLLDFTLGMENPGIQYLGDQLAVECGTHEEIDALSDIPSRSLLSRITDHYMQILGNQAPIGFEAEFVNQRGATILYRGILLPFSSDGHDIDFIYGVINWKEMADQMTTDELMLEIEQALEETDDDDEIDDGDALREPDPVTAWADGPASGAINLATKPSGEPPADYEPDDGADVDFGGDIDSEDAFADVSDEDGSDDEPDDDLPSPMFGANIAAGLSAPRRVPVDLSGGDFVAPEFAPEYAPVDEAPVDEAQVDAAPVNEAQLDDALLLETKADEDEGLYDCLAAARELALAARSCEDRSRSALYAAVGRAYDFSLAAQGEQQEFDELVAENGLTVQDRAPMTPVVKLVFGADYDKTRLTEYAAVLSHAHRNDVGRGMLAGYLAQAEGGLKGIVKAERQLRREENGKDGEEAEGPQEKLARKLRSLEPKSFDSLHADGDEFGLVMIRRMPNGDVVMLGEITCDTPLVERAARKLVS